MTGTITKRVSSGEATESTTKRMLAAVTEVFAKRVTVAPIANNTVRFVPTGLFAGATSSSWGRTWGIPRQDDGAGSLTSRDGWSGAWSWLFTSSAEQPTDNSVKRVPSGAASGTTPRMPANDPPEV